QPQQRAIVGGEEIVGRDDGRFVAQPDEVTRNRAAGVLIVDGKPRRCRPVLCGRPPDEGGTAARKANEKSPPVHNRHRTPDPAERNAPRWRCEVRSIDAGGRAWNRVRFYPIILLPGPSLRAKRKADMESIISNLLARFEKGLLSRRELVSGLATLAAGSTAAV